MKQYKIIQAYQATEQLTNNNNLPAKDLWEIYRVRKALRPHFEFQAERENALREKYKDSIRDDGMIVGDAALKIAKDLTELSELEVEFENQTIPEIHWKDGCGITIAIVEALDGFIDFIPVE